MDNFAAGFKTVHKIRKRVRGDFGMKNEVAVKGFRELFLFLFFFLNLSAITKFSFFLREMQAC